MNGQFWVNKSFGWTSNKSVGNCHETPGILCIWLGKHNGCCYCNTLLFILRCVLCPTLQWEKGSISWIPYWYHPCNILDNYSEWRRGKMVDYITWWRSQLCNVMAESEREVTFTYVTSISPSHDRLIRMRRAYPKWKLNIRKHLFTHFSLHLSNEFWHEYSNKFRAFKQFLLSFWPSTNG